MVGEKNPRCGEGGGVKLFTHKGGKLLLNTTLKKILTLIPIFAATEVV
jgi:hypothetical protein